MAANRSTQDSLLDRENPAGEMCIHHWLIDRPAGPISMGVCRICGAREEFKNSFEGSYWGDDSPSDILLDKERLINMSATN